MRSPIYLHGVVINYLITGMNRSALDGMFAMDSHLKHG
jgi:hypothetical protein